jgi:predicted molibdopterin-dependent oxidoreductase YjgC
MTCGIPGMEDAGCLFLFGYNPNTSHPIVARRVVRAKEKGARIIVADPRFIETARIADLYMPIKNGCNVAFLNSLAYSIIDQGLVDEEFVREHTNGFEEFVKVVEKYPPEATKEITGVDPGMMKEAAYLYATAEPSAIFCWGMGVCQSAQNVEAVHTMASIACITHQIGKPNSGLAPVRGQNNVQGACDMGALPNFFPGYQSVTNEDVKKKFADAWNIPVEKLSDHVGYKITDIGHLIDEGKVHAFVCMGEDGVQTEPDAKNLRRQLLDLDFHVCLDIFMTQTSELADVILPATSWAEHECVFTASDRTFQYSSKALPAKGECRDDWDIICDLSTRMGYPMHYENTEQIWDEECRALWPGAYGATYEKMAGLGYAQWPIPTLDHPGTPDMFLGGKFSKPDRRAQLIGHDFEFPTEMPDEKYPLVLCTVREVGHYSCRSMTGNCKELSDLADEPGYIHMSPKDAADRGIRHDELVWAYSRRGKIITRAFVDDRINDGAVYMTYQWWIGKCNDLALHHVDTRSRTPEDKFCAVQVERIDDQLWAEEHCMELYMALKERLADAADRQYGESADEKLKKEIEGSPDAEGGPDGSEEEEMHDALSESVGAK